MGHPDLTERFPDLREVQNAPPLFTLNGCGFDVRFEYDHCDETDTFVKTWCVTFVFVPVLALSSYRVARADGGGWHFLGRHPLPPLAKAWNALVVLVAAVALGSAALTGAFDTPESLASAKLSEAQQAQLAGDDQGALALYCSLDGTPGEATATAKAVPIADALLRSEPLASLPPVVETLHRCRLGSASTLLTEARLTEVVDRASAADADARSALAALDTLVRLRAPDVDEPRAALLRKLLAADPTDVEAASALAVILERSEAGAEACRDLLEPLAEQLGSTDGARILGGLLAADGEADRAASLLRAYVDAHRAAWISVRSQLDQVYAASGDAAIAALEAGEASEAWYAAYEVVDEEAQRAAVFDFVADWRATDPAVQEADAAAALLAGVVPATMELGMLELHAAQSASSDDARRRGLEAARELFASIRADAGDSVPFILHLAKVQFWLGDEEEARQLLASVVSRSQGSVAARLQVAGVMREVGLVAEAREVSEAAHAEATNDEDRHAAANVRRLLAVDLDDLVTWLARCDQAQADVQADLASSRGALALRTGDWDSAATEYRAAVALLDAMQGPDRNVNNLAIARHGVYLAAGDTGAHDRYVDELLEAERQNADDAIVLSNVSAALLERATLTAVGDAIDLPALHASPWPYMVYAVVQSEADRQRQVARLAAEPSLESARARLERLRILSPKSRTPYAALSGLYQLVDDAEGLDDLARAAQAADLEAESDPIDRGPEARARRIAQAEALATTLLEGRAHAARRAGAVAVTRLSGALIVAWEAGELADVGGAIELAQRAHELVPSVLTADALARFLTLGSLVRLETHADGLARFVRFGQEHELGAFTTLALALDRGDSALRATLVGDPELQRAASILRARVTSVAAGVSPATRVVLSAFEPEAGDALSAYIAADAVGRAHRALESALDPQDVGAALRRVWAARDETARRVTEELLASLGAPGFAVTN